MICSHSQNKDTTFIGTDPPGLSVLDLFLFPNNIQMHRQILEVGGTGDAGPLSFSVNFTFQKGVPKLLN